MVQIREHQSFPTLGKSDTTKTGHMHIGWSGIADFNHEGVEGEIIFNGTEVAIAFKNRRGHFHIDFNDELEALIETVKRGDYDVH